MALKKIVFSLAIILFAIAPLSAQDDPFKISTKLSVDKIIPEGEFSAAIIIDIADKHLLYKDDFALTFEGVTVKNILISKPKTEFDTFLNKELEIYEHSCTIISDLKAPEKIEGTALNFSATIKYKGCSDVVCFLPQTKKLNFEIPAGSEPKQINQEIFSKREGFIPFIQKSPFVEGIVLETKEAPEAAEAPPERKSPSDWKTLEFKEEKSELLRIIGEKGWLIAFLIVFGGGILISFTPCVYPLIPITLAVIGAHKENVSAVKGFLLSVIYVFGISITYGILGLLAGTFGSIISDALNSPVAKIIVAAIFIILALSMFGLFEIQVPSFIQTKLRTKKRSGLARVFLMGVISGCIATPCLAPPLAAVLTFIVSTGNKLMGFFLSFAFAWGIGLLLVVVGTLAGFGRTLPKASGWMITVKNMFGFALIAAALYFTKTLIPPALFEFFFGALLFVFGIFIGAFDAIGEGAKFIKKLAKGIGIIFVIFGIVYLAPFLAYKLGLVPFGIDAKGAEKSAEGISWLEDPSEALKQYEEIKKPMLIEFRQDGCYYCDVMERDVLSTAAVAEESRRLVNLKVDFSKSNEELTAVKDKFAVFGTPTFIFINTDKSFTKRNGAIPLETFLALMKKAK